MFPTMKETQPFEPNVDVVFPRFGAVEFRKRCLRKLRNLILEDQFHWVLL